MTIRPAIRKDRFRYGDAVLRIDGLRLPHVDRPPVSLTLGPGDKRLLTGPSGSGKSTLLRCVVGLEPPGTGRISVDGEADVWARRRRCGYVAQDAPLPPGTVGEALRRPLTLSANRHLTLDEATAADLLTRLRLPPDVLARRAGDLSGGERARVALAGALLLARPLLLIDEPLAALDPDAAAAVAAVLLGHPAAMLIVTHDRGPLGGLTSVSLGRAT